MTHRLQVKCEVRRDICYSEKEAQVREEIPNLQRETLWIQNVPSILPPSQLTWCFEQLFPVIGLCLHISFDVGSMEIAILLVLSFLQLFWLQSQPHRVPSTIEAFALILGFFNLLSKFPEESKAQVQCMPIFNGLLFLVDFLVHVGHQIIKILIEIYVVDVKVSIGF